MIIRFQLWTFRLTSLVPKSAAGMPFRWSTARQAFDYNDDYDDEDYDDDVDDEKPCRKPASFHLVHLEVLYNFKHDSA